MFGHYYYGENWYGSRYYGGPEQLGGRPSSLSMTVSVGQVTVGGDVGVRLLGSIGQSSGNNANTGTVSSTITVPAGTTLIVVGVSGYQGTANGYQSMTFTKGSVDTAMTKVTGGDISTSSWQGAMFYMIEPDIGVNKSLKWDWAGAGNSVDGSLNVSWTFWGGVALVDPLRGSGYSQGSGLPRTTDTINCYPHGDLVIAWCSHAGPQSDGTGAINTWSNLTELAEVTQSGSAEGTWATGSQTGSVAVGVTAASVSDAFSLIAAAFRPVGTIWVDVTGNTMATAVGDLATDNDAGIPTYPDGNAMAVSVGQVTLGGNIWVDVVQTGAIGSAGTSGNANTGTVSSTIEVPADAELILVGISGSYGSILNAYDAMTFTKSGVDSPMTKVAFGDAVDGWQGALFYMVNPDTGSNKTLKWDWIGSAGGTTAAAQLVTWTFWKGIEPVKPVRYATAVQVVGTTVASTGTMDIRVNANDSLVAFAAFYYDPGGGGGEITEWSGVTEIGNVNSGYAEGSWAATTPVLGPVAVETAGNGTAISLMAVTLRSISALGEVFPDAVTMAVSVGTVVATPVDNRQYDGWDCTTVDPFGSLSAGDKVLTSVAGATAYTANSAESKGPIRTADENYYSEVLIEGGNPNGFVGIYNRDEDQGILLELESGDIVYRPSGETVSGLFGPVVDGDVVGMAYKADAGMVWFRVNGGNWNGDAAATPEGWDWPSENTTGYRGDLVRIPDDVSSGTGWIWRFDDQVVIIQDNDVLFENYYVPSTVIVRGTGVTIRNCLIEMPINYAGIDSGGAETTIEYVSVFGTGGAAGSGNEYDANNSKAIIIAGANSTVRYCHIRGTSDAVSVAGADCVVEYNYCHDFTTGVEFPTDDPHTDGFQIYPASDRVLVQHNYIDGETRNHDFNAAIIMATLTDFVINHNLMTHGGFTVYIDWRAGNTFTNNLIGRGGFGYMTWDVQNGNPTISGNVDAYTGAPILPPYQ